MGANKKKNNGGVIIMRECLKTRNEYAIVCMIPEYCGSRSPPWKPTTKCQTCKPEGYFDSFGNIVKRYNVVLHLVAPQQLTVIVLLRCNQCQIIMGRRQYKRGCEQDKLPEICARDLSILPTYFIYVGQTKSSRAKRDPVLTYHRRQVHTPRLIVLRNCMMPCLRTYSRHSRLSFHFSGVPKKRNPIDTIACCYSCTCASPCKKLCVAGTV